MKQVVETTGFHKEISREIEPEELDNLLAEIAANPLIGQAVPETGNIRYIDVKSKRKNQVRVCYLSDQVTNKVIMLGVYKVTETNLLNCALHKLSIEIGSNA